MLDNLRWRDFVALPEDDTRELVDGRLVEVEVPNRWHERMVMDLGAMLRPWAKKRGMHVLGSGYRVRISDRQGAQPDVQVLTEATYRSNPEDGLEHGHPEHDRVRKVDWHASLEPSNACASMAARTSSRSTPPATSYSGPRATAVSPST